MWLLLHQTYSEEDDDVSSEGEEKEMEEEDAGTIMKLPALERVNQEFEHILDIRQEEFAEVERGDDKIEEERKDKKVGEKILNSIWVHLYVFASLIFLCSSARKLYPCAYFVCVGLI